MVVRLIGIWPSCWIGGNGVCESCPGVGTWCVIQFRLIAGEASTSFLDLMDNILRGLEDLSRNELVWLNTYLAGRLRALPPENEQPLHPLPKAMPNVSVTAPGTTCSEGLPAATVAPLPERIDALNYSLDPWSVRALPHKAGQPISSRQWCLSRGMIRFCRIT